MDFDKFKNPETYADAVLEAQEYIDGLNSKIDELQKSKESLMESNQKMFMRITNNIQEDKPKEKTKEEIKRDFVAHFIKEDD